MSTEPTVFSYGSLDYQSATNSYIMELTVQEISTSIENNTSQVSYTLKLISGGNNRFSAYHIGAAVWLGGSRVGYRDKMTSGQMSLGYHSSITLLSDTVDIYHNADGSYVMPVTYSIDMEGGAYTPGSMTASGQMNLSVIPRKSTISATDADIGKASIIAITKQADSFRHSIAYSFENLSGYITANGGISQSEVVFSNTAVSFQVPECFYAQIPNNTTGQCKLTVKTYSGSAQIGESACGFAVTAARYAVHPLATADMTDINETTVALTGNNKTMIRHFSTARCEMWISPRGSATISHAAIGDMYKPLETDASGYTCLDMPSFSADEVYFYTIDSRGYDYGIRMYPTVVPYIKLTDHITTKWINIKKGIAQLQIKGMFFSGDFGAVENMLHIQYRRAGEQTYIDVTDFKVEGEWYTATILLEGLNYRQEYGYDIQIWDSLMTIERSITLPKGQPVFHWGAEDFQFCVPVGLNENPLKQVHSINGLRCGSLTFDQSTAAYVSAKNRSLALFGIGTSGGGYALYLVMLDSAAGFCQSIKLSGTLDIHFSIEQEGILKVESPALGAHGWYIQNGDDTDLSNL